MRHPVVASEDNIGTSRDNIDTLRDNIDTLRDTSRDEIYHFWKGFVTMSGNALQKFKQKLA